MSEVLSLPDAPMTDTASLGPTADEFCRWVGQALPSERFQYHVGELVLDRTPDAKSRPPEQSRIHEIASVVRHFADSGFVLLVQQRLGTNRFAYLAIKASPRVRHRRES